MIQQLLIALGGLGLFLIGMHMMTDGLRALAGNRIRRILRNSTSSPARGAAAGALTTAMVQSSSATTVAAVGFVGAGLMSFEQSLGIIFGANIGTTVTGWLVALLGFKLQLGTALMPVALAGALMRLFAPGRWKDAGWALAGFSVLFFGIEALQQGMGAFAGLVTPDRFPADGFWGRLQLVGLGVLITIITQSSSAGVASALAALAAGAINFPQAAALVIGMDVGTTFSAALATLGGSVAARRTGFSHVIYNCLTGIMAFALLWPLGWLADAAIASGRGFDPQIWLVAFHSFFNLIGVVAVLGVADRFARLVLWLVPDRRLGAAAMLDTRLLQLPASAIDAASAALRDITAALFADLDQRLDPAVRPPPLARLDDIRAGSDATRAYLERIRAPQRGAVLENQLACLNALDHLDRLRLRCAQSERLAVLRKDPELRPSARALRAAVAPGVLDAEDAGPEEAADALRRRFREDRSSYRDVMFARAAAGEVSASELGLHLDASRWLQRSAYHVWRILHHLRVTRSDELSPGTSPERAAIADAED